jgi:hypothetical protein
MKGPVVPITIVRLVCELKQRSGYKYELAVCLASALYGTLACVEFTRKEYIPENVFALFLGLCPALVLVLDTYYGDPFAISLPLFAVVGGGNGCVSRGIGGGGVKGACMKSWNGVKSRIARKRQPVVDIETGVVCDQTE